MGLQQQQSRIFFIDHSQKMKDTKETHFQNILKFATVTIVAQIIPCDVKPVLY